MLRGGAFFFPLVVVLSLSLSLSLLFPLDVNSSPSISALPSGREETSSSSVNSSPSVYALPSLREESNSSSA